MSRVPATPMTILIVVDRYVPEARSAAHLFHDLATGLAARGHRVRVVAKYPTENIPSAPVPPPAREVVDGVEVVRLSSPLGEPRAIWMRVFDQVQFAARVFWHCVSSRDVDVILVYSPPLPLAAACGLATLFTRAALAVNLHDLYPRTAIELGQIRSRFVIGVARMLERFVYGRAKSIIVPSPESETYVRAGFGRPDLQMQLVYNWIPLSPRDEQTEARRFREAHGLERHFLVTYAGVVGLAQDLSAMVEAARKAEGDPELMFLVIGEGATLAQVKQAARGLSNLRFLPVLSREAYLGALQASDIGLIALAKELSSPAIPFKLQSIMAVGRPVVAVVPEGSAAARVVLESGCGLVTPPGDGQALLDAVTRLRADPGLQTRLADAGYTFAGRHFRLESAVDAFEQALRSVVQT
jgi:colanic acid biosynthesis glycosyl transferase WcaI